MNFLDYELYTIPIKNILNAYSKEKNIEMYKKLKEILSEKNLEKFFPNISIESSSKKLRTD